MVNSCYMIRIISGQRLINQMNALIGSYNSRLLRIYHSFLVDENEESNSTEVRDSPENEEAGDLGGTRRNVHWRRGKSKKASTSKERRSTGMGPWDADEEQALRSMVKKVLDENKGRLCIFQ